MQHVRPSLIFLNPALRFDSYLSLRILVIFMCWLGVSATFFFRGEYIPNQELGSISRHYIISPITFSFPDEQVTKEIEAKATQGIDPIYVLDRDILQQNFDDIRRSIREEHLERSGATELLSEYSHTIDLVCAHLAEIKWTTPHTLARMQSVGLDVSNVITKQPLEITEEYWITFPDSMWHEIRQQILESHDVSLLTVEHILEKCAQLPFEQRPDAQQRAVLIDHIRRSVPQKLSKIEAGAQIVGKGDVITKEHLHLLHHLQKALQAQRYELGTVSILYASLFGACILLFFYQFLVNNQMLPILQSARFIALLGSIYGISTLFTVLLQWVCVRLQLPLTLYDCPVFYPFPAILIITTLPLRVAFPLARGMSFIALFFLASDPMRMVAYNIPILMAIFSEAPNLRKRKRIFRLAFKILLASMLGYGFYQLFAQEAVSVSDFGRECIMQCALVGFSIAGALFFIPSIDSVFSLVSESILLEYSDPNLELLKRLATEAPGTYQHSLLVGQLAEACAARVGANATLCRVGALYHDIGKLACPHYFAENQNGLSVHKLLTSEESAQVIIGHVEEGLKLAEKYCLPELFRELIKQHHGTNLVYFFYQKSIEEQKAGSTMQEHLFRYPGPIPQTKESAILMICDSVEAAFRTLKTVDIGSVDHMVERIIAHAIQERQFESSGLTFQEIRNVHDTLVHVLLASNHTRVHYPQHPIYGD